MIYLSTHPELEQPVPRRVKMKVSAIAALIAFVFMLIISSYPVLIVAEKSFHDAHFQFLCLIVLLAPLSIIVCILFNLLKYLRERKLLAWGTIAEAETFEGPEFAAGRVGRFMNVSYEFKDADGNSVEGTKRVPARSANWKSMEKTLQKLDHPVVLYEPRNSKINMLYPGSLVDCLPSKQK